MFRILAMSFAIIVSSLSAAAWAADIDTTNPYKMVDQVATKTFGRIKSEKANIEKNPEVLRDIVSQELMPYVDSNYAAMKVLGKYYRNYPKEKVYEYINDFQPYIVSTYANALTYYNDQTVEFEPEKDFSDEKQVSVKAIVKDPGKPDIKLAFIVRKDRKTGAWQAYDMVVEGISLVSSKQSEFESILRQQGLQTVIDLMKEKTSQKIDINPEK
ncbi:phospholipid-binding protein MlaC [Neptunicella sp. SCSIO 80796]|uniref:phospholipid-binding protein MlaC n=1 Tax=Neptunicella plasticusilytica TaxID=3117012 RepID=UPI003A4DCFA4